MMISNWLNFGLDEKARKNFSTRRIRRKYIFYGGKVSLGGKEKDVKRFD
jgi:hypothetical protein